MNSKAYMKMLVHEINTDEYVTDDERFLLWDTLEAIGSKEIEDGNEHEVIKHMGKAYTVPMYLDENNVNSRGYTNNDTEEKAFQYEGLCELGMQMMNIDDLYDLEAEHTKYVTDDGMWCSTQDYQTVKEDENRLTPSELMKEVHYKEELPMEAQLERRVIMEMESKKKTPGLGYHLNGGKVCMQRTKAYHAINKSLKQRIAKGKVMYKKAEKEGNMELVLVLEGHGQELERDRRSALTRLKAVYKHYGKTYDPKAYHNKIDWVKGLHGLLRGWYNKRKEDTLDKWVKMSNSTQLQYKREYCKKNNL